jgi:hypothetical protein
MRRSRGALSTAALLLAAIASAAAASASCGGNSCGLGQLRTLSIPPGVGTTMTTAQFFDVDLSAKDIQQINFDSTSIPLQPGQVDGFLTTTDCTQLFAGSYTGNASAPLCQVYLGPIAPGGVSARVTLPAGRYRVFAQPWTTNTGPVKFGFDVVIWGQNCALSRPIDTSPF